MPNPFLKFPILLLVFPILLSGLSGCQKSNKSSEKSAPQDETAETVYLGHLMAGELRTNSAILQARLTVTDSLTLDSRDKPGKKGLARFHIWPENQKNQKRKTGWLTAKSDSDFIVKRQIKKLQPNTPYRYRVEYGPDKSNTQKSALQRFTTLAGSDKATPVVFTMSSCTRYEDFMVGGDGNKSWDQPASDEDSLKGYPGLVQILKAQPQFYFMVGDNVYYDHTAWGEERAKDLPSMRRKWHRIWHFPRMQEVFAKMGVYFMKDDHDYRFDDGDTTQPSKDGYIKPSHEQGVYAFREATPIVPPARPEAETYRTIRVNTDIQIWMLENRDYRSPNDKPDGPQKTMWGDKQKSWLKRTLKESEATFKMILSPTPMVGPDDSLKSDNHTNLGGFRHEGQTFFDWLEKNNFDKANTFIVCGDRHWQYHSIHPTGYHEYASGALTKQNARYGREPGDPESTDPEGNVEQPYIQEPPKGGFLRFEQGRNQGKPYLNIRWISQDGKTLYRHQL